jgi:hypothetical protein
MTCTLPRLEVSPARVAPDMPVFFRPHFICHLDAANVSTDVGKRATRWGAVRAARKAAGPLWVHVLDDSDPTRTIRTYPPRGTR